VILTGGAGCTFLGFLLLISSFDIILHRVLCTKLTHWLGTSSLSLCFFLYTGSWLGRGVKEERDKKPVGFIWRIFFDYLVYPRLWISAFSYQSLKVFAYTQLALGECTLQTLVSFSLSFHRMEVGRLAFSPCLIFLDASVIGLCFLFIWLGFRHTLRIACARFSNEDV
jgi:hypothetical protein